MPFVQLILRMLWFANNDDERVTGDIAIAE